MINKTGPCFNLKQGPVYLKQTALPLCFSGFLGANGNSKRRVDFLDDVLFFWKSWRILALRSVLC